MKTKQHKHWILGAVFRSNKVNKRKRTFKKRKKKNEWFWSANPKYTPG